MSMHWIDVGQGPPVLLIHGLMASVRAFDPLIARAKAEYRLLGIDLPCSGKSDGWAPMNPEALAIKLDQWMNERGVYKYSVIGHSFGGLVAMQLAARAPQRIDRMLVMSAPAMGMSRELKTALEHPSLAMGASMLGRLPVFPQAVRAYVAGFLFGPDAKLSDVQLEGYVETLRNPRAWSAMLEAIRAVGAYSLPVEALRQVNLDVLWGGRDKLVPVIDGERLATSVGAGFEVLTRVGHCVPEEAPDELLEWLRLGKPLRKVQSRGRDAS